jgi:hypothetical protein
MQAGTSPVMGQSCVPGSYCPTGTADYLAFPTSRILPGTTSNICRSMFYLSRWELLSKRSSAPSLCLPGTHEPSTGAGSSCQSYTPDSACPHAGMTLMTLPCAAGHYCPSGTIYSTSSLCPAGTFTDSTSLVSQSQCTQCPEGYSCGSGSTSSTLTDCPAGRVCSGGAVFGGEPICPAGTYSSRTKLVATSECTPCPAGSYCVGGMSSISGPCQAGYYCPVNTGTATSYPCLPGTYSTATNLVDSSQCTDCPAGSFCVGGLSFPVDCPPGTYSPLTNTASSDPSSLSQHCLTCPAGYSCTQGTVSPVECGVGTYSSVNAQSCAPCPAGYYCGSNTTSMTSLFSGGGLWSNAADLAGACFNGTYCSGQMTRAPDLDRDACPAGYYCPSAATVPLPCPSGTYCQVVPAGFYSISGASSFTGMCEPGYYCPAQSTGPKQVPCPARYYRPEYGGASLDDCSLCVAGGYCPLGTSEPLVCPFGYYCPTGIAAAEPCPLGTFGNSTGLRREEDCQICDPGYYCDGLGMTSPRGPCDPGFYCLSGSTTSAPVGVVSNPSILSGEGGICPTGSYCPLGSTLPIPCPVGTFNNHTSSTSSSDCHDCTPGFYCEGIGNKFPSGQCFEGYYCTGGASTPTQHESLPGSYSLVGATASTGCAPGTYNDKYLQSDCLDCPEGYYCPHSGMSTFEYYNCTRGHYCPAGSSQPLPCPVGTFSAQIANTQLADCLACSPGYYCDVSGQSAVAGPCKQGYYCASKATLSVQLVTSSAGGPCTSGHYCPEATGAPIPCPRGTYMASTLATGNISYQGRHYHCDLCPSSSACSATSLTSPDSTCRAGYFCKLGAPSPQPVCGESFCTNMYGLCPVGHYCPSGTADPIICSDGTYMNHTGASSCDICPSGHYCEAYYSPSTYRPCPLGFYCPQGTGLDWIPCPVGKYGSRTGLQTEDECTACDPGKYCNSKALHLPAGNCSAGFYCPQGAQNAWGLMLYTGNLTCPRGSYCPEGSSVPIACPRGTYNPNLGQVSLDDCLNCPSGQYCDRTNLTSPTGFCSEGYYCLSRATSATPLLVYNDSDSGHMSGGNICPVGTYCPLGSPFAHSCPPGTLNNLIGQVACLSCPEGYFCPGGTSNHLNSGLDCPIGYYCPNGTQYSTEYACPPGTFNNLTKRRSLDDCFHSPPGYYSQGAANSAPSGQCLSAYYCPLGASTSTPSCSSSFCLTGGRCSAGQECPVGTGYPISCRGGKYCETNDGTVTGDCQAGYYCTSVSPSLPLIFLHPL